MTIKRMVHAAICCVCVTAVFAVMSAEQTQAQYGYRGGYYGGYPGAYGRPAGYGLYPPYRGSHFSFSFGRSRSGYYPSPIYQPSYGYNGYSYGSYYTPRYVPAPVYRSRIDFDDDDDDGYRRVPRFRRYDRDDDDDD